MSEENTGRGLLIVYSGDGKGKTTAALGMCLRVVGHGWKVCVIQFVKGSWKYGELEGVKRLAPEVELHVVGRGFVGVAEDSDGSQFEEHCRAAREGLELARGVIEAGDRELVILDELCVALDLELLNREEVEKVLEERKEAQHLVITGRGAPDWLLQKADLVTEMKEIQHPYQKGIKAMKGIDW